MLQDAGIKLTSVASTILGKTGRTILAALLAGQDDPAMLAELAGATGWSRRVRPVSRCSKWAPDYRITSREVSYQVLGMDRLGP